MRSSTFKLSTSQQVIFAVVFTLAFLFAGCSDSVNPIPNPSPGPGGGGGGSGNATQTELDGSWIYIESQEQQEKTITHRLSFNGSQGSYLVTESPKSDECDGYANLSKVFNYEVNDDNTLDLDVIHHTVCSENKGKSEEKVRYILINDDLRIFNKTFEREN